MDAPTAEFALAGSLAEFRAKGRLVVHGGHRPILVVYDPSSYPNGRLIGEHTFAVTPQTGEVSALADRFDEFDPPCALIGLISDP